MKYLRSATLKNFQSHKDSFIEFDKNLNVIVGPSDSGKSAIIRGIKWALYNEPAGDFFIREGESKCSVTLEFSDNTRVKRIRSKSKNIYILYRKDGEEFTFEGFGTKVPQEIIDEIGIRKIYLDSSSTNAINLGEQLEGAFLLSEKSSIRASAIGRIIGVNVIDDSLREILRDVRNYNSLKNNLEDSIDKSEKELKEYDYLDDLSDRIDEAETINNLALKKTATRDKLKNIYESYKTIKIESSQIQDQLSQLEEIDELNNIANSIEVSYRDLKDLKIQSMKMETNNQQISETITILNRLKNMERLQNIYKNLQELKSKRNTLIQIEDRKNTNEKHIINTEDINNKLEKIPLAEETLNLIATRNSYLTNLTNIKNKLETCQKSIQIGVLYLKNLADINIIENIYDKLQDQIKNSEKLRNLSKQLSKSQDNQDLHEKTLKKIHIDIENTLSKYKKILSKQEVCPFCLNTIDDNQVEHIMNHYL